MCEPRKKEFTEHELYECMKYVVYCMESKDGARPRSCAVHKAYQEFLEQTKYHCGDCTQYAASCLRCRLWSYEITAQNIVEFMFSTGTGIGYCGKKCLTECDFEEGKTNIDKE